jgi:sulfur-carrier protein
VTFIFSGTMLRFVDFAREVEIPEPNLERALTALLDQRPELRPVLLDGAGNLRRSHQMFLNGESMDPRYYSDARARAELATEPDDSVYFLTAIAGG